MSTPDTESNVVTDADDSPLAKPQGWRSEDWLAVIVGLTILICAFVCAWSTIGPDESHPWKSWIGKPGSWESNPLASLSIDDQTLDEILTSFSAEDQNLDELKASWGPFMISLMSFGFGLKPLLGPFLISILGFGFARKIQGESLIRFLEAFPVIFLLATMAYVLAGQVTVKHFNLEYALWALAIGLLISNTVGTPEWLRPAVLTELYIKTGLVILGAEVLWHRLLAFGLPGICVAWIVTPIVLITTYWFGTKVLRIPSRSLNMVISADMSVCGVSAAIATAASCRAKKEELSFAIAMSLAFTVVMMVVMPILIRMMGLGEIIGGAWMGGTIDSTGAVVAAGSSLGEVAEQTASTVKMVQNILIGVTAFGVAVYWVFAVESDKESGIRPDASEIWRRFPKFVLGFVCASLLFTFLSNLPGGEELVSLTVKEATKGIRGWFFCMAFVSIGLESRFADLRKQIHGGKPLLLYVCGQSLNLALTLLMAYLMFGVLFADYIKEMLAQ